MSEPEISKEQFIRECEELRTRIAELEKYKDAFEGVEKAFQETQRCFTCLVRNVPDVIYRLDPNGRILFVNEAVKRYGYRVNELLGKSIFDIVHPDDLERSQHRMNERRTGDRRTRKFEVRLVAKDQSSVPFELHSLGTESASLVVVEAEGLYSAEKPDSGNFLGTIGVARDISERKTEELKREEILEGLRTIVSMTDELMACPDVDTVCRRAVELTREKLGVDRCGLFLKENDRFRGTYGTDSKGNTTAEHENTADKDEYGFLQSLITQRNKGVQWTLVDSNYIEWDGEKRIEYGKGPVVATYVNSHDDHIGMLFNDNAISGKPIDEARQEVIAVFGSLLGSIIQNKRIEQDLRKWGLQFKAAQQVARFGTYAINVKTNQHEWSDELYRLQGIEPGDVVPSAEVALSFAHPDERERMISNLREIMAGRYHGDSVYRIIRKDGALRYFRTLSLIDRSSNGTPRWIYGFVQDITEQKRIENELRESEEKYRDLVENLNDVIFTTDKDTVVTYISPVIERLTDYKPSEIVGSSFHRFLHPDDLSLVKERTQLLKQGQTVSTEYRLLNKDGSFRWIRTSSRPLHEDGKFAGVQGVLTDNEDLKRAERALRFAQYAIDQSKDAAFWVDRYARIYYVNDAACTMLGYTREEILKLTILDIDADFTPQRWEEHWANLSKNKNAQFETRELTKDGRIIPVEVSVSHVVMDEDVFHCAFVRDITDRKHIENELRTSEEKYRELVENLNDVIFTIDQNDAFSYVSPSVEKVIGYKPPEVIGQPVKNFLHPDDRNLFDERRSLFVQGHEEISTDYRLVTKDGNIRWVRTSSRPLYEDGEFVGIQGILANIDELKRAERALRFAQYSIDQSNDTAFWSDCDANIYYANDAACNSLGYTREELLKLKIFDIDPDISKEGWKKYWAELSESKTAQFESRHVTKDGHIFPVEVSVSHVDIDDKVFHCSFARNISDRKRIESELRASEEKYRDLVENLDDVIFRFDENDTFTYVSPSVEKIFGFKPPEIIGQLVKRFVHPDDHHLFEERKILYRQGQETSTEYKLITKDGGARWVRISSRPRFEDGKYIGIQGILSDIEKLKRAEEALRFAQHSIDQSKDAAFWIDRNAKICYVNDAACSLLGYTREELLKSTVFDIRPEATFEEWNEYWLKLAEEKTAQFEFEQKAKDGRIIPTEVSVSHVEYAENAYQCAFMRDITDRKRIENEMRASEEKHRDLVENLNDVIFVSDLNGLITYMSPAIRRLTQYEPSDFINSTIARFVHPDDHVLLKNRLQEIEQGKTVSTEYRFMDKDGSIRWIRTSSRPMKRNGKIVGVQGIFTDIQDLKQVERALHIAQYCIDQSSDGAFWIDQDARFYYVNDAACRSLGYTREELLRMTVFDVDPEFTLKQWEDACQHLSETGNMQFVTYHRRKDGSIFPVEISSNYLEFEGSVYHCAFARDITERKKAEEKLLKTQTLLNAAIENSPAGIIVADAPDVRLSIVNTAAKELRGQPRESITEISRPVGEQDWKIYHPDGRPFDTDDMPLTRAVREGITTKNVEMVFRQDNGEERWALANAAPIHDENGNITGGIVVLPDITERKRIELEKEALRSLARRLAGPITLQEMGKIMAYESRRLFAHDAFYFDVVDTVKEEVLAGYSEDTPEGGREPIPVPAEEIQYAPPLQFPKLINRTEEELTETEFQPFGSTERLSRSLMFMPIRWEDQILGVVSAQSYTQDRYSMDDLALLESFADQCSGVVARLRVEEEKDTLHEQLRQAQKMEAVGQLAGGIAHDFNNLLQAILGYTEMSLDVIPEDNCVHKDLTLVKQAAERAATLTRQLLAFSRRQILQPKSIDLNQLIADLVGILRRVIGEHIELDVKSSEMLGMVRADRGMIEQVLMNLCVNARDAMPDGGRLTIETCNRTISDEFAGNQAWAKGGDYVCLSVTDTGVGMPPEILEHIFEPFFTTKEVGKGTGLGLAMVYGIIKQHDGFIDAQSTPGQGTKFHIYLPLVRDESETQTKKLHSKPAMGTETILIAEDESIVRNLAARVLEENGYTVLIARDGEEALRLFEENGDIIDLAMLDVVMPKLSGPAVYEKVRESKPNIDFLFVSGYAPEGPHMKLNALPQKQFLQKPFSGEQLLHKVRSIFEGNQESET